MSIPPVDTEYLVTFLRDLLNLPSPTGFAHQAIEFTRAQLSAFPLRLETNRKGALIATWEGERGDAPRGLTAHVDTLGAMVKEIKSNGRLNLTKVGGFAWNTVEGEGVTIYTSAGETRRGSLLLTKASSHVHGAAVNGLAITRFQNRQGFGVVFLRWLHVGAPRQLDRKLRRLLP